MQAACYAMDIYCDLPMCGPYGPTRHSFNGETHSDCRRQARKLGWKVVASPGKGQDICPSCNRKQK